MLFGSSVPVTKVLSALFALAFLAGCAGQSRDPERDQYVCTPQFALPAKTTIPVTETDVPPKGDDLLIANTGEIMISHGSYSRVTTARVISKGNLEFMYPDILGLVPPKGRATIPDWVDDALSGPQMDELTGYNVSNAPGAHECEQRALVASNENKRALEALDELVAALPASGQTAFGILETQPGLSARGDLITTVQGTFVSGLTGGFLAPVLKGAWDPWPGLKQNPVTVTGLFIPADSELPLMVQVESRGRRSLTPTRGSVSLTDEVTRPVRREPADGVLEQTLVYQGRSEDRLVFTYHKRKKGGASAEKTSRFVYPISRGSLVTYMGSQFEIVEATPYQIRYRLYSSFTPPPAFANP